MDNKLSIFKYFEDRKWKELDFKQTDWTKHTDYNWYYLGNEKNERGKPINCNGVIIDADIGKVRIATFHQDGYWTYPNILIYKDGFRIEE